VGSLVAVRTTSCWKKGVTPRGGLQCWVLRPATVCSDDYWLGDKGDRGDLQARFCCKVGLYGNTCAESLGSRRKWLVRRQARLMIRYKEHTQPNYLFGPQFWKEVDVTCCECFNGIGGVEPVLGSKCMNYFVSLWILLKGRWDCRS
jgi:hypothetical protein